MRRAYIFVYSEHLGAREEMKKILDSIPQIVNWRFELPNSFYLISESTAQQLCDLIADKCGEKAKRGFLVAEINANRQGFLDKESWTLLTEKHLPR